MSITEKTQNLSRHGRDDGAGDHTSRQVKKGVLLTAVALTLGYAVVELIGGLWSHSLALIGDAGHMATDSFSLAFALVANILAQRGADARHSYGHGRIEVMAAFVNALFMLGVIAWIFFEAYQRFMTPPPVAGAPVIGIAGVGLLINLAVAWSLSRDRDNMNTRAALIHVLGDLLGSVAAIAAGIIIYFGGPVQVDPILSCVIGCLILHSVWGVLCDTTQVLLDGVPSSLSYEEVGSAIEAVPGVKAVHDLHVWVMTQNHNAVSAHIQVQSHRHWPKILKAIRAMLKERYHITHVTLQPEWIEGEACCADCKRKLIKNYRERLPQHTPEPDIADLLEVK